MDSKGSNQDGDEHSKTNSEKSPLQLQNSGNSMMAVMRVDTRREQALSSGDSSTFVPPSSVDGSASSGLVPSNASRLVDSSVESSHGSHFGSNNTAAPHTEQQQQHCCSNSTTSTRLPASRLLAVDIEISNPNQDTDFRGGNNNNASSSTAQPLSHSQGTFENVLSTHHVATTETEKELLETKVVTTQLTAQQSNGFSAATSSATRGVLSDLGLVHRHTNEDREDQRGDHITISSSTATAAVENTSALSTLEDHQPTSDVGLDASKLKASTKQFVTIAPKEASVQVPNSAIASTRPDVQSSPHVSTSIQQVLSPSTQHQSLEISKPEAAIAAVSACIETITKKAQGGTIMCAGNIGNSNAEQTTFQDHGSAVTPNPTHKGKRKRSFSGSLKAGQTSGRWTHEEHQAFLEGLKECGREWKKVAMRIPTRTSAQIRSHAQKYFAKLQRDHENNHQLMTHSIAGIGNLEDSPASVVAGEGGLLTGSTVATHPSNSLTPSVQRNVDRIMADPRSAQQEVENTLEALRERYRQLQQRLENRRNRRQHHRGVSGNDGSLGGNSNNAIPPSSTASSRLSRKQLFESPRHNHHNISGGGFDENSSVSSNVSSVAASRSDLGNEEIIALQVLGDDLPRGDSSVEDTASATAMATVEFEETSNAQGPPENDAMDVDESSHNTTNRRGQ